jgi:DNA-binding transcriptional LysR family regulator
MQLADRIGCRIKLHDLHVLMSVVQAGSMSKAATLLNTGQSAISRSIAELERTLGVSLVDRNPKGVEPTEYGRALLDGGTAAFDDLREAVRKIASLHDPSLGELRIATTPVLAAGFVSTVIDRLYRRHPRIAFHLATRDVDILHRDLRERAVDLLVARRFGPLEDRQLDFNFLFNESYFIATSTKNPWSRRRQIKLADLVDEPWILPPPDSVIGTIAAQTFSASGLAYPSAAVSTLSPEVRFNMLASGRFLTILSASALQFSAQRAKLKILPVNLSTAKVPNGIITLKRRTLNPTAQLFILEARQVAKAFG